MTLKEWYKFNGPVLSANRVYVCAYSNNEMKKENQIFSSTMQLVDAVRFFSDLEVCFFNVGCASDQYSTLACPELHLLDKNYEQVANNA